MLLHKSFPPLLLLTTLVFGGQYEQPKDGTHASRTFKWPGGKRGALSLSFDDARPSQVDNGVPLLNRHEVKATFYVSPANLKQRLRQWKQAVADGHEIGNHSLVHPCSGNFPWSRQKALENYTLEKMKEELRTANQTVEELLGVRPTTFAYPCGQTFVGRGLGVKSYVPLVAAMFQAGRGWQGEAANDPVFCDLAQITGVPMDDLDFEQIRPLVEQAMQGGFWLVLAGHDIASEGKRQVTRLKMLEALCDYASDPANGIWIDTVARITSHILGDRPL